ncbi:MAG: hypothetical protein IPN84_17185 [Sphingomonadales bacterium]|jgi:hypothetical protein|nr:hypothetical protein [Sphingomonadales bacterium]
MSEANENNAAKSGDTSSNPEIVELTDEEMAQVDGGVIKKPREPINPVPVPFPKLMMPPTTL